MLEFVGAQQPVGYWSVQRLAEESPEDAGRYGDETRGVLFHSGDGDGAVLIGTTEQLVARLEEVVARLRATAPAPVIDGEQVHKVLRGTRRALPAGE